MKEQIKKHFSRYVEFSEVEIDEIYSKDFRKKRLFT